MTRSETEIGFIWSNWTDKQTGPCFYNSTVNDRISISTTWHYFKYFRQPAFGTFAKPHMPGNCPSFAKEPNFASISLYWRNLEFQNMPEYVIFGKNWVQYAKSLRK